MKEEILKAEYEVAKQGGNDTIEVVVFLEGEEYTAEVKKI